MLDKNIGTCSSNPGEEALQLLLNSLSGGAASIDIENSEGIIDQLISQNP